MTQRIADLGRPGTAVAAVKSSLPRRLSPEDAESLSFQSVSLPVPQRSHSLSGQLPLSRSTTTSYSSSCRGIEDVNWDEMFTASRPDTLCGSQQSQPAPSPASRSRWEPQLGSPILPRPVLSGSRPLRRPSSTSSLGRFDDLLAAAATASKEVSHATASGRHRRPVTAAKEPDLKQLVEMFPSYADTRLRPLSEIFDRLGAGKDPLKFKPAKRQEREEKLAAESTAQQEAKLQEAVTFWEAPAGPVRERGPHELHEGKKQRVPAMSPISERTEKATPPHVQPKREAHFFEWPKFTAPVSSALLSWAEAASAPAEVDIASPKVETEPMSPIKSTHPEVKDFELPEEMLAPPEERSPFRAEAESHESPRAKVETSHVTQSPLTPKVETSHVSQSPLTPKVETSHVTKSPLTPKAAPVETSEEPERAPSSPTLKGLLQSMEEDEHFAWLARLGPVRPLTLDETLQDMAITIATVDAQLLSAHPPSQLEANAQLQEASNRAAEAVPAPSTEPRSPQLHQEEEPREPRAPAATPSAEIAGELLRKKVKSPILSDTPDTASVISRGSKKEIEDAYSQGVGTPDSSTLARFLNTRRSPAPSTTGTPRPSSSKRQVQGSRSRVSSEDSNAYSDVSFFGQSSVCEPGIGVTPSRARGAARGAEKPRTVTAAAATPKTLIECALCGRKRACQPGSCFCSECSQRMNQIDPASPSSDDSASGHSPMGGRGAPRQATKAEACVICGQRFVPDASGSVLCPSCLKGRR